MKKLSLMIACVGIVSAAAFGSGLHKTNPQDDSKKQTSKPAPKTDAAGKPIEVAQPVQAVTESPATKPKTGATVSDPSKVQTERAPSNVKEHGTQKAVSTPAKKAEDSSLDRK